MQYLLKFKKIIFFSGSEYSLQYIRDLYDKMFPCAKDYIKFLRERINTLENEESNQSSFEYLKKIKKNTPNKYFYSIEKVGKDNDNIFEEDHWKGLSTIDIIFYKDLTEQWLKTKTRRQRRIWNYFVLGVPKNSIAPRLKENTNFVRVTIKTLQKEFLVILKN